MSEEKKENIEKKITYSWGPLYETLKEMYDKGDPHEDPLFTRAFELFSLLDNAQTLEKVREILKEKCTFTQMEINRINSPCLDGILYTINHEHPLRELVRNHWNYIESCKFYLNYLDENGPPLFMACVNGRTELVKLFLPCVKDIQNLDKKHLFHACIYHYKDIIKILCDAGVTMSSIDFESVCCHRDIEIVKLVYNPLYDLFSTIVNVSVRKRTEILKFLLEKTTAPLPIRIYQHISERGGTTHEILELLHDKVAT